MGYWTTGDWWVSSSLSFETAHPVLLAGKTVWLYAVLIQRVIQGYDTIIQDKLGQIHVFEATRVWRYNPNPTDFDFLLEDHDNVWVLVDSDVREGNISLMGDPDFKVVVASSPKTRKEQRWFRHASQKSRELMMYPWSDEELRIARFVRSCVSAQRNLLTSRFELFHVSS